MKDHSPLPAAALGRAVRRILGAAGGAAGSLALAVPARAHGEVTGVQDVIQDYGVLLFLVATVLIGAGVLAWVTFSPQPDEDEDEEAAAARARLTPQEATAPGEAAPEAAATPATPEGSRASR